MSKIKVQWSERMFYEAEIEVQGNPTEAQVQDLLDMAETVTLKDGRNVYVWDELMEKCELTDEEDNYNDTPITFQIEE